ncbi:MAG: hypothetical protein MUF47_03260, partial [Porphyrobacter sp.]|nr:hypothetical protein [Porphyrobacter sp.]
MLVDEPWVASLKSAYPALTDYHVKIVKDMISGFVENIDATRLSTNFLNDREFGYISARLISHHATSGVPLRKENFEHALEYVFRLEGKDVPPSTDPTRRGADIVVDGHRVSLKTCSTNSWEIPSVDISKYAECRSLREPLASRNANDIHSRLRSAISSHLQEYDEVILFAHCKTAERIKYEMMQIPK